jgi:hypothetical protein
MYPLARASVRYAQGSQPERYGGNEGDGSQEEVAAAGVAHGAGRG